MLMGSRMPDAPSLEAPKAMSRSQLCSSAEVGCNGSCHHPTESFPQVPIPVL